jgi:uncharacterized membrane protein HdeD (DUF308 family)
MERTVETREYAPIVPWWLVFLEGLAAIIIGVLFFAAPGPTTLLLVQILGWYWLIAGIFSIVSIFMDRRHWGWKLISGILGIVAGFLIIQNPIWSTLLVPAAFLTVVAVLGIVIGVIRLFQAFSGAGIGVGLLGLLSIIFGVLVLTNPTIGTLAFLTLLALVAVVGGVLVIIASLRMRAIEHREYRRVTPVPMAAAAVPVTGERREVVEPTQVHEEPFLENPANPPKSAPPDQNPPDQNPPDQNP